MIIPSDYAVHLAHGQLWLHHRSCGAGWINPFHLAEPDPTILTVDEIATAVSIHQQHCRLSRSERGAA